MKKSISSMLTILVTAVSMIVSPHHITAQNGGSISYGESVQAELSGAGKQQWTFEGAAEDEIVISLVTTSLDASLTLLDSNGDLVDTDDSLSTQLTITLAMDGIYTIVVANNASDISGSYTLALSLSSGPEMILQVEGDLPVGETTTHAFTGNENDHISMFLITEDFDAVIALFDSSGTELASDDDSGGQTNSLIVMALPNDGEYTVEVGSYFGDGGGNYSLLITSGFETISLNSTTTAEYENDSVVYAIAIENPVSISIAVNSEDFDPIVSLKAENGETIGLDDDSGGDFNALLNATLEADNTYFVVVRAFSEDGAGEYELVVTTITDAEVAVEAAAIAYGEKVTTIANGTTPRYEFEGQAGDEITISLSSTDFDTVVELFDSNGTRLMANDDIDSDNLNSEIVITLPVDDTYQIVVSAFDPPPIGEFTLILTNETQSE